MPCKCNIKNVFSFSTNNNKSSIWIMFQALHDPTTLHLEYSPCFPIMGVLWKCKKMVVNVSSYLKGFTKKFHFRCIFSHNVFTITWSSKFKTFLCKCNVDNVFFIPTNNNKYAIWITCQALHVLNHVVNIFQSLFIFWRATF